MFLHTLRRLTGLNSLVFLLVFIAFTSILYGYLSFRLYDKVDDAMRSQLFNFRIVNGRAMPPSRMAFDPRIFLLLRGEDGRIIYSNPFRAPEEISNARYIATSIVPGELQTLEYDTHVYRVMCIPYQFEERRLNSEKDFVIRDVIAVSIVDSEVGLLNNVVLIILAGVILGTAGIIMAGYFLAKRAMIPIQQAWEKQQRFVADASHELRSPITGIHSNAELILRHPEHTVEQESHRITTIIQESMRMTKLIASLLTLARTDAGKAELHLAAVNLSEVIEVVVSYFHSLEEVSKVALIVECDPDITLHGDRERLHQLLVILLDNAIKYTPASGQVHICCRQADKQVLLLIHDTGIGIAPDHLPHIFDRFFRADKARSRDSGGTGLGLSIAKWIVEKHGGKIKVESELGQGTKVFVYFPFQKLF